MLKSSGINSKILVDITCDHAYTVAYVNSLDEPIDEQVQIIVQRYEGVEVVNWIEYENGNWLILDTIGGIFPDDTFNMCQSQTGTRYFIDSCVNPIEDGLIYSL